MSIYTRTGDDGTTSLYGGKRVSKSDPRIDLYGSLDELNSLIGTLQDDRFTDIQRDLCLIEGILAGWRYDITSIQPRIIEMEQWIDEMENKLPPLSHFILPKGTVHIVRSACRRVERQAVKQNADPVIIKYLNRLSDLLFVFARFINKQENIEEIIWK